ncbi:hypothetical protein D770_05690 [Flammeovirgaceae bacterium 311]|nr:hypothetical protein D770_05690 [Flammeovirgaceae bacterium 311]
MLDELYFLQSFNELMEQAEIDSENLKLVLGSMLEKGWVRCLRSREGEEPVGTDEFSSNYSAYHYLATKAGLLAHNTR